MAIIEKDVALTGKTADGKTIVYEPYTNVGQVKGAVSKVNGILPNDDGEVNIAYKDIPDKPVTFEPAYHTHNANQVNGLAAVATSGSYNDLEDKPTIERGERGAGVFTANVAVSDGNNLISNVNNGANLKIGDTVIDVNGDVRTVTSKNSMYYGTSPTGINIKGADGANGAPGKAATITVGQITTGLPGTAAFVTNVGSSNAAVFNFTIPQGEKGEKGERGADGADGTNGASGAAGAGIFTMKRNVVANSFNYIKDVVLGSNLKPNDTVIDTNGDVVYVEYLNGDTMWKASPKQTNLFGYGDSTDPRDRPFWK